MTDLERAIQVARDNIPIYKEIVREECQVGYTIVQHNGQFRVYQADAWVKPTGNLLPWSPPEGEPVADVALDGTVSYR